MTISKYNAVFLKDSFMYAKHVCYYKTRTKLTFGMNFSPILISPLKDSSSRTTLYGFGVTSINPFSFPSFSVSSR